MGSRVENDPRPAQTRRAHDAVVEGESFTVRDSDLLLFCHGFCDTLSGHHLAEDTALFPELRARYPQLESHFRYEERQLLDVLATLKWDADPRSAFG